MQAIWQDLRYGARMLAKHPGFTVIAALTLALGIGANSAIFSVVNSVLFRELLYREPNRLVMVWSDRPLQSALRGWTEWPFTPADFRDLRDQNRSFEQMSAFSFPWGVNLTGGGGPEVIVGLRASANLFAVLGVKPMHGRAFLPEEEQPGNNRVLILSERLWQRQFGADPQIIGQKITLDDQPFTVVGVAPPDFQFPPKSGLPAYFTFPPEIDFYTPLSLHPDHWNDRGGGFLIGIARLKSHIAFEQGRADLVGIAERLAQQYPSSNKNESALVVPFHQQVLGKVQPALLSLLGATGFVLLIACVNVANLLLVRGERRQKEMAIRAALGAGRWRVIRQLLTESLLLAALAGALAILLAIWCVDLLREIIPENMPRSDEIGIDLRVFGFTLVVSFLTGIIFGLIPAILGSRTNLNDAIKEGGRSSGGGSRSRLGGALVVAEVALALLLLVGAGLMLRSFMRVMSVDPGFDPENVLTMSIGLRGKNYGGPQQEAFFQQALERLSALPGVRSAGAVFPPLGFFENSDGFDIIGRPPAADGQPNLFAPRYVSTDYFKTMKIQLLKGRVFNEGDGPDTLPVVIINEALAQKYWPSENPIGQRLVSSIDGRRNQREIIGIVRDVRYTALDTAAKAQMYFPFAQFPYYSDRTVVVRTDGNPLDLVPAARDEIRAIDKDQPISYIRTMEDIVGRSVSQRRFNMFLLAILAGLALLLAAVGIYGVMSYSVEQRTHEIGLRMALGAQPGDVRKLVIRRGMALTLIGVVIGLIAAFGLTRLIKTLLFEVSATDPVTFVVIAILLAGVSLMACYLPARRATKVDPIIALKYE